ncbi:AAA family ATPase [Pantoea sp. FN0305]|uniref:AAA family ATPase n=1 Tax=Pantoea sp. FN0305 TaxID=3418559 RepID=UPI003CEDBDB0
MLNSRGIINSSKDYFILVGKNGSGKSRLLHNLAEEFHDSGYTTIAVSNTLFDKFQAHQKSLNYNYIGSKLGRNFPAQAIKKTLSTESKNKVNSIFSVLDHIGYEQRVGISVKFKKKFKDAIRYNKNSAGDYYPIFFDNSDEEIPDELKMAIDKAIHQINYGYSALVWLNNQSNVFYEGNFDSYLLLLKFERLLKKANIISGIDVFLSKGGKSFPLSFASSGELSFIALLVHIAFCANDRSFIFIDEPENSLHPQWQREYFDLLKGAIGYNGCKVVVATHSPLIISSVSENNEVAIFKRENDFFTRVESFNDNAEELYIDYFDTLTPKNRALSNRCVDIIDEFTGGEISLKTARERLAEFQGMSNDFAQKKFLKGVGDLISKVAIKKGFE